MKAIGLLSGGLDSTLALKLILDQGIDVIALNFTSPFCTCNTCHAIELSKKNKVPFKVINKGKEYFKILRNPKHGYGRGMNPCIDCRIFILKKAKKLMKRLGAKFIFTGEVLDQRPMSQHLKALNIIEKESGLEGLILRPLSAKLLPETIPEKKHWVNRKKLLRIKGRSRKEQIRLAKKIGVSEYPCPAGGCILTNKEYANKIRDLFKYFKKDDLKQIRLLKIGRHFRLNKNKIIVGRNQEENKKLTKLKNKTDYIFEVPDCGSPITILQNKKTKEAIKLAAELTATYSDAKGNKILVKYGKKRLSSKIIVKKLNKNKLDKIRI